MQLFENLRPHGFTLESIRGQGGDASGGVLAHLASSGEYRVVSDYTYRYEVNAGPRWLLIGDAADFIDPIFSSGVMLSIKSGHLAVAKILASDKAGTALPVAEQKGYTKKVGQRCKVFLRMIKMFDDRNGFDVFMSPARDP